MRHSCLGIFLAFLFIIFFSIAFSLWNFKTTLLNPHFLKQTLKESKIYQEIPKIIKEFITQSETEMPNKEKIKQVIEKTLTPQWAQKEAEKNINNIFKWLFAQDKTLKLQISAIEFRNEFIKEFGVDPNLEYTYKIEKLGENYELKNQKEKALAQLPMFYVFLTFAILGFFALSIAILAIILVLARKSIKSLLRWPGVILMLSTVGFLIIGLLGNSLAKVLLPLIASIPELNPVLSQAISSLINALFSAISKTILYRSSIIFGFGLILLIISFFIKEKQIKSIEIQS